MRFQALLALLMACVAVPASAQPQPTPEKRIKKLEEEMRAVQRKVFPGAGRQAIVEPEIGPQQVPAAPAGVPAASAVADLTARVDALEAQLARLTGQAEEAAFKLRQQEQQIAALRAQFEAAQAAPPPVEQPPAAAAEPTTVKTPAAEPSASVAAPSSGDPAEDAYITGFRLWEKGNYAEAQRVLEAMAVRYPKHRRASWARNLAGRALLDDGKATAAAKALFANYEADPKGERAQDSLFYLGDALVKLKKNQDACKVYDELQGVYGAGLRDALKRDLPKARATAGCL